MGDKSTEMGWKHVGPRKKFWHFFRSGLSLCSSWALFNTAPPYILLPPSEGLICKRCLALFNAGPQLVAEEATKFKEYKQRSDARAKAAGLPVVDVEEREDPDSGCWAEEDPGPSRVRGGPAAG